MAAVKIYRGIVNSDPASEVHPSQWGELLEERRKFCEQIVPRDCRNLLFFIQDGAANNWLGLKSREQYIREGLNLDPKMVEWALIGLKATRPDVAVDFAGAIYLGKNGGDRKSEEFRLRPRGGQRKDQRDTVTLKRGNESTYIIARLRRDGRTELLERIERREITPHAAAIEAGFRKRLVQVAPTVEGFAAAGKRHLSKQQLGKLKELL